MKLNFTYIIYTLIGIYLFWVVNKRLRLGLTLTKGLTLTEGLTNFEKYSHQIIPYPENAIINYNDVNSPLYSHTVNLPINDPVSCKNFCGPNSKCLLTGEQCTSDVDCSGCNPGPKPANSCIAKEVDPYDATGKLGQNQGLQYSSLTTGFNNHYADFAQLYDGSKDNQIKRAYEGADSWETSFNKGLELYNKKTEFADNGYAFTSKKQYYEPKYPKTVSATGLFYETTPPASNSIF